MTALRRPSLSALFAFSLRTLLLMLVAAACGADNAERVQPLATATARTAPPPVSISPEPQGVELVDPAFEPLAGARAEYGRLGGTVYRIEVPKENWNRTLVLYIHGFRDFNPRAQAEFPAIRHYLIRRGYAWGTSSFSSTAQIPGRAADETAAVWDRFVQAFERPNRTYLYGESMGGLASLISAERYADRYDGALAMCAPAGQDAQSASLADFFIAGAFAAGVTQADFEAFDRDVTGLVNSHVVPALQDPERHRLFEDLLIGLTGGPRPFDRNGLAVEEAANWSRSSIAVASRLAYNTGRVYAPEGDAAEFADELNRLAVRVPPDPERVRAFVAGNEITGELKIPVVTVRTTGDMFIPVSHDRLLRRKVDAAGKGDLLQQFMVQAPGHCTFAESEIERGIETLVAWVEDGVVPEGEDVLASDLGRLGAVFTRAPRFGSPQADQVAGADQRTTFSGVVMVDGVPSNNSSLWIHVLSDGLWRSCTFAGVRPAGHFERVAAADVELEGCGAPGALYSFVTVRDGKVYASDPQPWPGGAVSGLQVDLGSVAADSAVADFTRVSGAVLDEDGERMPPGTVVEAYIGEARCGAAMIPRVKMDYGSPDELSILVGGPELNPECASAGEIRFRTEGLPLSGTATNLLGGAKVDVVLTLAD